MDPLAIQQGDDGGFVVQVGDEAHAVDLSGFVSKSTVSEGYVAKDFFESELSRRVSAAKKGLVKADDLLNDEDFIGRVVETHGPSLAERLRVQPKEADLETIRTQVRANEVTPLTEKVEALEGTLGKLQRRSFDATYLEAAKDVVAPGVLELLQDRVYSLSQWSDEAGEHVIVDAEGKPRLSPTLGEGRSHSFMTVGDYLDSLEKGGKHKEWFVGRRKSGADTGPAGGRGSMTLEQFEKLSSGEQDALYDENPTLWTQMQAARRAKAEERLNAF